jgi:O-acetyl-ADP-ribose deacetylase (regulator of RNase III)
MLKVVEGDLFNTTADLLIHGANCHHLMGHGVAYWIAKEYPGAVEADKRTPYGNPNKLGTYSYWIGNHARIPGKEIVIINAYTQFNPGKDCRYMSILDSLKKIVYDFPNTSNFPNTSIAIPFIGAGIAGGNPHTIFDIFTNVFINSDATLFIRAGEFTEFLNKLDKQV